MTIRAQVESVEEKLGRSLISGNWEWELVHPHFLDMVEEAEEKLGRSLTRKEYEGFLDMRITDFERSGIIFLSTPTN